MKKLLYLMTLLVLVSVSFVACLEEDSNPSTPTTDPVLAAALVDSANRILEIVLFNEINGEDPEKPSDIDLTQPYNLYVQAVDHDPENPNANFGAGILELVMLSQDAQVNDFFDKVKDFAENGEFFIAEENSSILNSPRPKFEINKVTLPVVSALHTPANLISSIDADTPLISELQQIFMDRILPRMNNAIEYLTAVTENEDFRFDVSAKMQGDVNEDPVELDLTEVYASLSFLEIQKAMLLDFCAYDYSMSEYTGAEMLRAFTPGSSFMSLYNNGTDRMQNALASWKDAVNHLEAGINFLEHETDNQGDDLIRIDPNDGIMRSDLDTLKHYIPKVRNALNSSEIFVFNFDDVEREITISLASYFNTPIQDYKALLPVYSVELETISIESESIYVDSTATVTVSFEQEGYYSWYRSLSYEDGEEYYRYEDIDFYSAEIEQIWSALFERLSEKDDFYLSINLGGYFNSGAQDAICNINYSYEDPTKFMYVPKIIWEANSFNEWIFPDPTFGGLMPNMTDARFKEIFNIDGEGWEKTVSFGN